MRAILAILVLSAGAAGASEFDSLIQQGLHAFLAWDLDAAENAYTQACPAEKMAAFPWQNIALCEHLLGSVAEARGHSEEAVNRYLKSLDAFEKLGSPYLAHTVSTLTNLGALYHRLRRLPEAETLFTRALALSRTLEASDPELHAIALSRAGALYNDLDQTDRAHGMLDEAVAGLRALARPNAPELAYALNSLATLDISSGHYKAAESEMREALTLANGSLGENNPATAAYGTNLALALLLQGQYSRAETLLNRARFVVESRLGPENIQMAKVLSELTSVETALGHYQTAEDCGEKALSILSSRLPAGSLQIALAQLELGAVYLREHNVPGAEKILPGAVDSERHLLKDGKTLADGIRQLAALRAQQHNWSDAESLYREAIGLYEHRLGPDHPDIAPVLRAYAEVLKHRRTPGGDVRNIEARARAIEKSAAQSQGS